MLSNSAVRLAEKAISDDKSFDELSKVTEEIEAILESTKKQQRGQHYNRKPPFCPERQRKYFQNVERLSKNEIIFPCRWKIYLLKKRLPTVETSTKQYVYQLIMYTFTKN